MNTLQFFEAVWPDAGIFALAWPAPQGKGFWHKLVRSHAQAAAVAQSHARGGRDAYFAVGTLAAEWCIDAQGKKRVRVQENISSLKAFILDLDVGNDPKKYPTQLDAIKALKGFCDALGWPMPMLVSSGYGVHCYWLLTAPVPTEQWRKLALQIKHCAASMGLLTDPSRTADAASILRPVGTLNFKDPANPRPVELIRPMNAPVDPVTFARLIIAGATPFGLQKLPTPAARSMNTGLGSFDIDSTPADFPAIARQCAQVKWFVDKRGDVSEPEWYHALQLIQFTQTPAASGAQIAHALSKGHSSYSEEETDSKLNQLDGVGPTLCTTFESDDPSRCHGCPHKGAIKSPISLGKNVRHEAPPPIAVVAITQATYTLPPPEFPYFRTSQGEIAIKRTDKEGNPVDPEIIYEHDLYPVKRMFDEATETELYVFKTLLPKDGWRNVPIAANLMYDSRALMHVVASKGILPSHNYRDLLGDYMRGYMRQLQKATVAERIYMQMGWKENNEFVVGDMLYGPGAVSRQVEFNEQYKHVISNFGSAGSLDVWKQVANVYNQKGYEEFALGLMIGFGSPMFPATGYAGAMFSLCGESGAGKSTLLKLVHSIYGKPKESALLHQDTTNAKMAILAAYNNLPVTFDEITNTSPEELSALCYAVSNGREKQALHANRAMRSDLRQWRLPVFVTTNRSLYQALSGLKAETSGEVYRVLERRVVLQPTMDFSAAREVFAPLEANYGLAGPILLTWYIDNKKQAETWLAEFTKDLSDSFSRASNERFWISLCAIAMLGCKVGNLLGLHSYSMQKLRDHCGELLGEARATVGANERTARDALVEYLNHALPNTLVLVESDSPNMPAHIAVKPSRGLTVRKETKADKTYIDKTHLRAYCTQINFDFDSMERELARLGIAEQLNARKVLGEGTEYATSYTRCMVVSLGLNSKGLVVVPGQEATGT